MPTAGPTLLVKIDETPWSMNLTVGEVPLEDENGIITHYNITFIPDEFIDIIKSVNITIDVRLPEDVSIWNNMSRNEVDCDHFENNPLPLSSKPLNFSISGLFPFTNYDITAYPCTRHGCSDVGNTVTEMTAPTFPSCPVNITMGNTSSTSLQIDWSHLPHKCIHGDVQEYFVMLYESEEQPPVYNNNRTADATDILLELSSLKSYWNYSAVLYAGNQVGYGPPSNIVWAMTDEDSKSSFPLQ